MFDIANHTKESFARLFETGIGVCSFFTPEIIELSMMEAKRYHYRAVLSTSNHMDLHQQFLGNNTDVMLGAVFSYPYGDMSLDAKKCELKKVIDGGAVTVDGVLNMSFLKAHQYDRLQDETSELVRYAHEQKSDIEVKFIVECAWVEDDELAEAARIIQRAGADFIKTQTGWVPPGGTLKQIGVIRKTVGPDFGLKITGKVTNSIQGCIAALEAGADIIGEEPPRIIENFELYKAMRINNSHQ